MSKILLIAPLTLEYSGIEDYGAPSLGVWRIASFLESRGHTVSVYDCNLQTEEWLTDTLKTKWDIIGISVLHNTLRLSVEMFIRLSGEQADAILVAGGPEAMSSYQDILENAPVHAIVLAEGELPMLALAEGTPIGEIPGLITRKYAVPVTDDLLWQYYENIDFSKMGWREYWAKNRSLGDEASKNNLVRIVTTSHCPRRCQFCSVSGLRAMACGRWVKPAYLDGEHVRRLLDKIIDQLPEVTHVYFIDDTFLPTPSRINEFCDALRPFKDRVKFLVQTDTDKASQEIIAKLAEVGVIHVTFGVESCSPRIRKLMNKPQDGEKIENIIHWCKELGVRCYYLIILFAPDSTIDDLRINYETLTRWQDEGNAGISIIPYMMPYRSAPVYYSDFEFEYERYLLSNGRTLKQARIIWPRDPQVRKIMEQFRKKAPEYLAAFNQREGHAHRSKDYTGRVYIELLGDLLRSEQ